MKILSLSIFLSVTVHSLQLGHPASHQRLSRLKLKPTNVVDEPENFLLLGKSHNEFTGERSEKSLCRISVRNFTEIRTFTHAGLRMESVRR